jgi:two-component system sensor histidine kinase KdpD
MKARRLPSARAQTPRLYAETLLMVAGVTAAGLAAAPVVPASAMDLAYLVPVLAAASLYGLRFGVVASIASALAYNFFYTSPLHTLRIDEPENVVTVLILLGVALFTSRLTARIRDEAALAAAQARQNAILAGFTGHLVAAGDTASIGAALCTEVAELFAANTVFFAAGPDRLELLAGVPGLDGLRDLDREAAQLACTSQRPAGRHTAMLRAADWQFHPLLSSGAAQGVLGLARDDGRAPVDADDRALLASLLAQTALALERERLAAQIRDVAQLRDRDCLRGALLSSVGHDLRTPLTAIFAATAELQRVNGANSLVATLDSAAHRLDRYITNLLDMTRIEAGAIRLNIEATDLTDAVAAAVRELQPGPAGFDGHVGLAGHAVRIDVAPDLPLVRIDPQLFHHCLINLVDNAAKHGGGNDASKHGGSDGPATHGGSEGGITISAARTGDGMTLSVCDTGPGLPSGSETRIFETFTRLEGSDRDNGTGLGLSIVKGFAEAMGIAVGAHNRKGGGAVFDLYFPTSLLVTIDGDAA